MLKGNPQGVILAPVYTGESALLLEECNNRGIPVVLINANICTGSCIAFIGQDSLQSGMVAARLMHYGLKDDADILIINFTREKGNQEHILKREEGFRKYYRSFSAEGRPADQLNIAESGSQRLDKILENSLLPDPEGYQGCICYQFKGFQGCRVSGGERTQQTIILIGYDLLRRARIFC
jgi:LacI family transcriptional regulator